MRRVSRPFLTVALVVVAVQAGCLFDGERPGGTAIACKEDGDCSSSQQCVDGFCAAPDVVPPGQIVDLDVDLAATTDTSLTLVFTAPGDDGNGGGRGPRGYSATLRVQGDVDGEPVVVDFAATVGARERERFVVDGLVRGTVYEVVVEAVDKVGQTTASAPVLVETGGALCAVDPETGLLTARGDALTISRPEHLVRLYGCEVIDGSLKVVDDDCEITQLVALRQLRTVTGGFTITGNELCGRGLVDLSDLVALERVQTLQVKNTGTLVEIDLNATIGPVIVSSNRQLKRFALRRDADDADDADDANLELRIDDNPVLETIKVAARTIDLNVNDAPLLTLVALPNYTTGANLTLNDLPALVTLEVPQLDSVSSLVLRNTGINDLSVFAAARSIGSIVVDDPDIAACDVFAFAARVRTAAERVNAASSDADGNGVVDIVDTTCDPALPMPSCSNSGGIIGIPPACGELRGSPTFYAGAIRGPNLRTITGSLSFVGVEVVDFPVLTSVTGDLVFSSPPLTTLRMPALTTVTGDLTVFNNPALTTIELSSLQTVGDVCQFSNSASLCRSAVQAILDRATCGTETVNGLDAC